MHRLLTACGFAPRFWTELAGPAAVLVALIVGCGSASTRVRSSAPPCVRFSHLRSVGVAVAAGSHVTVRAGGGGLPYAQVAEAGRLVGPAYPRDFPWLAFTTTAPATVAVVAVCGQDCTSTEATQAGAFRAMAPG